MKKITIFLIIVFLASILSMRASAAGRWQDTGDELVVVIDPGHGGIDSGADAFPPFEKDRNLATAIAFANELARYDGVSIYLTRTTDEELTLKERAEFAASVNADIMISLHHNGSSDHSQHGCEIWIPSAAPNNAYCYQFAQIWEAEMAELGIDDRGAKVRINGLGRDYYGVIREAAYYGIPCVIIEQCYLDNPDDRMFCDEDVDRYNFARADAVAVAKYFGLHSDDLGVDYLNYDLANVDTALQYGEVHNDPRAGESTPPGPLAEGQTNPEFDSLREALAQKDPAEEEEIVTIEMPELNISNDPDEKSVSADEPEPSAVESVSEEKPTEGFEDPDAMMERLRREAAEKEALEEADESAPVPETPEKKSMLFPAIVFAVLLLAIMLILAFARDK